MPMILLETVIAAPPEVVFDLARSIDAHQESTRQTAERAVAGVTTGLLGPGEEVTWEARHFGIKQRLTVRIGDELRPLLRPAAAGPASSVRLQPAALELDSLLTQLLAGSYTEAQSTALLRTLPLRLARLQAEIAARRDRPQ